MLFRAVGIEELPGQIHDRVSVPGHPEPGLFGDHRDRSRLQVLERRQSAEPVRIRAFDHDGHPFLRLGNGQFGPVQSLVFLGHGTQIDLQAVGQFPDRNRYASGAEIVAALDHPDRIRVPEQSL